MEYTKPDFEVTIYDLDDVITASVDPNSKMLNSEDTEWYN